MRHLSADFQEPAIRLPFRLLLTGSRTWDDSPAIEHARDAILARHPEGVILVNGACRRGADAIVAAYAARTPGYRSEAHPADWRRHGRAAQARSVDASTSRYRGSYLVPRPS